MSVSTPSEGGCDLPTLSVTVGEAGPGVCVGKRQWVSAVVKLTAYSSIIFNTYICAYQQAIQ